MAYASLADVSDRTPSRRYTSTSVVSASMVADYLAKTAAVLDGILTQQRYQLPVPTSATGALEILANYNSLGAWAMAERAWPESPNETAAEKMWADAQKMLRDGLIVLPDAPRDADTAYARTPASCATPAFFPGQVF
jgi:hypothetical protein